MFLEDNISILQLSFRKLFPPVQDSPYTYISVLEEACQRSVQMKKKYAVQFLLQRQIAETERESQQQPGTKRHKIGRKKYSIILNFGPVILCCKRDYSSNESFPNCHCMFCPSKYSIKYIVTGILRNIKNVLN